MITFYIVRKENIKKKHNPNYPRRHPADPCRMLIIEESGSEQTKSFFNLINYQPNIDETYLYVKIYENVEG